MLGLRPVREERVQLPRCHASIGIADLDRLACLRGAFTGAGAGHVTWHSRSGRCGRSPARAAPGTPSSRRAARPTSRSGDRAVVAMARRSALGAEGQHDLRPLAAQEGDDLADDDVGSAAASAPSGCAAVLDAPDAEQGARLEQLGAADAAQAPHGTRTGCRTIVRHPRRWRSRARSARPPPRTSPAFRRWRRSRRPDARRPRRARASRARVSSRRRPPPSDEIWRGRG